MYREHLMQLNDYDRTVAAIGIAGSVALAFHIGGFFILTALGVVWWLALPILFLLPGIGLGWRVLTSADIDEEEFVVAMPLGIVVGVALPGIGFLLLLEPDFAMDTGRRDRWELLGASVLPTTVFYLCLLVPWPEGVVVASSILVALIALIGQVGALALAPLTCDAQRQLASAPA